MYTNLHKVQHIQKTFNIKKDGNYFISLVLPFHHCLFIYFELISDVKISDVKADFRLQNSAFVINISLHIFSEASLIL